METSEMELLQRIGTATREVQEAAARVSKYKGDLQDSEEWKAYQRARNDWKLCKTILDGAVAGTVRFAQLRFDQQIGAVEHGGGQLTAEQHLGALLANVMQQASPGTRPLASSIKWDEHGRGVLEEVAEQQPEPAQQSLAGRVMQNVAEQVNAGALDGQGITVRATAGYLERDKALADSVRDGVR